jgi:hypothetical protein
MLDPASNDSLCVRRFVAQERGIPNTRIVMTIAISCVSTLAHPPLRLSNTKTSHEGEVRNNYYVNINKINEIIDK